jgi:hypothetical protein
VQFVQLLVVRKMSAFICAGAGGNYLIRSSLGFFYDWRAEGCCQFPVLQSLRCECWTLGLGHKDELPLRTDVLAKSCLEVHAFDSPRLPCPTGRPPQLVETPDCLEMERPVSNSRFSRNIS